MTDFRDILYFYPEKKKKKFARLLVHVDFKGGYLDFSHLTKLKNVYITKVYMKK